MKRIVKRGRTIFLLLVAAVSAVLLFSAVFMLRSYSSDVSNRALSEAQRRTLKTKAVISDQLASYTAKAMALSLEVSECRDHTDVLESVTRARSGRILEGIKYVRYYSHGELYGEDGSALSAAVADSAREYRSRTPDKPGYMGVFTDILTDGGTMDMIGFYAPVSGNSFLDAVMIYYPRNELLKLFPESTADKDAEFSVLALDNEKCEILSGVGETLNYPGVRAELRSRVGELQPVNEVTELIRSGRDGVVQMNINAHRYVASVCADRDTMQDLAVVELYSEEKLCEANLDLVDSIIMIVVLFALIDISIMTFLLIRNITWRKAYYKMETTDAELECLNRPGFEKLAQVILDRNNVKASHFFVISMQLRHFKHIKDSYGEAEVTRLLLHFKTAIAKVMEIEETFGHCGEGRFLLLLHAKDREDLLSRLKTISYLANRYRSTHRFDVFFRFGIYPVEGGERFTLVQMIEFVEDANRSSSPLSASQGYNMQFSFYNDEMRKIQLMNEDMELRMESALKAGEFQLFYQPKYSLKNGRQDGCEALVRWYDPKTKKFNPPALFLSLFETNGFIIQLDKYVYKKVCEYISYIMARGGKVYPVSVNVSRLTAVQPDFVSYYYNTKVKYGISDGLIMIEFVESFAYEDYETLRVIVDQLHEKGFKCSIDDFGSGYSSYRVLKSLLVDEVKLDKFFLEKTDSQSRDDAICSSIIQLTKELGMKVTQEGVETKEELDRMIGFGCDSIQGFYYSRPLPLSDYIVFVANSREHNIT